MQPGARSPRRGEIWFVQLPTEPAKKNRRPVIVVSLDVRNRHERASTVLVVPLTTSIHVSSPTHVLLAPGETGLPADSAARAEDVTVVRKKSLIPSRVPLRQLSARRLCEIAERVAWAMGCPNRQ